MTVAVLVVASILVVAPLMGRPVGSAAPSGDAPRSQAVASEPPEAGIHALSAAELGDLVRGRSAELAPRAAVVRATLTISAGPSGVFDGAGDGFVLRLADLLVTDIAATGSASVAGPFLIRFSADTKDGRPVLDVVARLLTDQPDGWTSSVRSLRDADPQGAESYAAVDGWLVRTPGLRCAAPPHPTPTATDSLVYGCPEADYLTDEAYQPVQADGTVLGPDVAIELPVGSYKGFAPDPTVAAGVSQPRHAIYVLQRTASRCAQSVDICLLVRGWLGAMIVDRLEPIPPVGPDASPSPPAPTPGSPAPIADTVPPPTGDAWTVSELLAATWPVVQDREFIVRGWLVATPPLRCLQERPIPSGLPDYGCGEADWLTDDRFQPWTADGTDGSARPPEVGIRVQNGAFEAFASDPAITADGGREPNFGLWRVRFAVHSTCEYGGASPGIVRVAPSSPGKSWGG